MVLKIGRQVIAVLMCIEWNRKLKPLGANYVTIDQLNQVQRLSRESEAKEKIVLPKLFIQFL